MPHNTHRITHIQLCILMYESWMLTIEVIIMMTMIIAIMITIIRVIMMLTTVMTMISKKHIRTEASQTIASADVSFHAEQLLITVWMTPCPIMGTLTYLPPPPPTHPPPHPHPTPTPHPPEKMAANLAYGIFSNVFSSMKKLVFRFEFHWSFFLRVQLT